MEWGFNSTQLFITNAQIGRHLVMVWWFNSTDSFIPDAQMDRRLRPSGWNPVVYACWVCLCLEVSLLLRRLLELPKLRERCLLLERKRYDLGPLAAQDIMINTLLKLKLELELECLYLEKKERHVCVQPFKRSQMKRLERLCRLAIPHNDDFSGIVASAKRGNGIPRFLRFARYVVFNNLPCVALFKTLQGVAAGIKYLHKAWSPSPIIHSYANIEPKISDFGILRLRYHGDGNHASKVKVLISMLKFLHCDDGNHLDMIELPSTFNDHLNLPEVFSGLSCLDLLSGNSPCNIDEFCLESNQMRTCSDVTHVPESLSVFHALHQISLSAWSNGYGCETGLISANPKSGSPNEGKDSELNIRKGIARRTENEPPHPRQPFIIKPGRGIKAVAVKTSATWALATAAPHHATGNCSLLSGFVTEHDDLFVHAVDMVPMPVRARGAVVTDAIVLPDVWFVPGLTANLVSVSQLAQLGYSIGFGCGECRVTSGVDGMIVGKARLRESGLYVLDSLKVSLAI